LAIHLLHSEPEAAHLVENLVGGLDPLKGRTAFIVCLDVGQDRRPELGNAGVRPAFESLLREQPKEALHQVEPRRVGGREMEVDARMPQQPALHAGAL
jgi:hypothetical protein